MTAAVSVAVQQRQALKAGILRQREPTRKPDANRLSVCHKTDNLQTFSGAKPWPTG
jgi:hypothetical protein